MDEMQHGFGEGFSKEVAAVLRVWETGLLYPHEARANLAKAGLMIGMEVELPDIDLPQPPPDEHYEPQEVGHEYEPAE